MSSRQIGRIIGIEIPKQIGDSELIAQKDMSDFDGTPGQACQELLDQYIKDHAAHGPMRALVILALTEEGHLVSATAGKVGEMEKMCAFAIVKLREEGHEHEPECPVHGKGRCKS